MNLRIFATLAVVLAACEAEPPPKTVAGQAPVASPLAPLAVVPVAPPPASAAPVPAPVASSVSSSAPVSSVSPAAVRAAKAAAEAAVAAAQAAQAAQAAAKAAAAAAEAVGGVVVADADAGLAPAVTSPAPVASSAPATLSGTVTSTRGAASNAVVYLEGAPVEPTASMTARMTNKMMKFLPYVATIPVGGKVVFSNDDPFPHNVNSPDVDRFDLGDLAQNESRSHVFKTPGVYSILCRLHPAMLGYVVVAPSSYYAKVDAHGHFNIKNVPPGNYQVTAWAPHDQPATLPVTMTGADATVDLQVHR